MKIRCLTALLIALFFWEPSKGGKESFVYRGYLKEDAGRFVVLTKPQASGSICAAWEIEAKMKITLDGNEVSSGRLNNLENRPMGIKMTVITPSPARPSSGLNEGRVVAMELVSMDEKTPVNSVCSDDPDMV